MTTTHRPGTACRAVTVAALVVLLAAAGCGSSGDDRADGGDSISATTAPRAPTDGTEPVASSTPMAPDEPAGLVVIAHRGASADAPEHTFAAYDEAIAQGADYLELDVQLTADGELVVLHDVTLDRTARGPVDACTGPVADKTLDQLRLCEVGSWFGEADPDRADPAHAELRIPTVREVLDRYGPEQRYYIETKAPDAQAGMEAALLAALDDAGIDTRATPSPRVIVQSFSPDSLRRLHAARPDLALVQLVAGTAPRPDGAALDDIATYAVGIGPPKAMVDGALVADAHARCLVVHPYTVDDPAEMAALVDAGVDGMFTNAPARLVELGAPAPVGDDRCASAADATTP